MEKNKRKKRAICIGMVFVTFLIIVSISVLTRIHWKYNDKWIIGKEKSEIIERYGSFDYDPVTKDAEDSMTDDEAYSYACYYILERPWISFDKGNPDECYYIRFNNHDIAVEVYVDTRLGG